MERVISREDLYKLLDSLLKDYEVIGPRELPHKGIFYQSINNVQDLRLGSGFAIEPIKKFFLSPSEEFFRFDEDVLSEEQTTNSKQRIILGVRPCEIRGITLLDKVFNSEYKDKFYINCRRRTIIIGLACSNPDKSCFCTSMGGSPVGLEGMDAYLLELDDNAFFLETITKETEELFANFGREFTEKDKIPLEQAKQKYIDQIERKIKVPESLDGIFKSDYWGNVSLACISCGICTYLCPTCHCFDLVDEERKRLRCYDGCSFPDFTLQASGENPRPTKKERYRQRVFHKFDYFKKNFGENLCVGCGRCTRFCPVKIDIADVVDKIPVASDR